MSRKYNTKLISLSSIILIATGFACAANAQSYSSPWSFSSSIGTEGSTSGATMNGGTSSTLAFSSLNPNLVGNGTIKLRGRDFSETYEPGIRTTFEVRYALSDLSEVYGSLGYYKAQAKSNILFGCLSDSSTPDACTSSLTGNVSNFKQYTAEVGFRKWLGIGLFTDALRPYFAIHGGAAYTDAIHTKFVNGSDTVGHFRLYDDSWSYTVGADIGASYTITNNMELAAEVGVRYTDKLKQVDTDLDTLNLGFVNDTSDRVSFPLTVRLNTVF